MNTFDGDSLSKDELLFFLLREREGIRCAISEGANANALDAKGRSPLHCADGTEAVKALLSAGADPNASDPGGFTPLHSAVFYSESVEALLSAGANPNTKSLSGETPLHSAAIRGNPASIKMLLGAGADPNASTLKRTTPLHLAVCSGVSESVELLLSAGADPNAVDSNGLTPKARGCKSDRLFEKSRGYQLLDERERLLHAHEQARKLESSTPEPLSTPATGPSETRPVRGYGKSQATLPRPARLRL